MRERMFECVGVRLLRLLQFRVSFARFAVSAHDGFLSARVERFWSQSKFQYAKFSWARRTFVVSFLPRSPARAWRVYDCACVCVYVYVYVYVDVYMYVCMRSSISADGIYVYIYLQRAADVVASVCSKSH